MKFSKKTLSNGLRVLTIPMPSLESVTVTVWVGTGSRSETKKINGLSHFLEHMAFKGSKKRPTAIEISQLVDSIGGEFNASTSKEWTNFYIKARSEKIDVVFDVLSDMILNPILSEEEANREKGVILSEISMYEDTPMYKVWDVFENLIFGGHKLGWDVIGTSENIKAMTRRDFINYRGKHYFAENMILTVAGRITEKKVVELAKMYFGKLRKGKKEPVDKITKLGVKRHLVKNKKNEQAHIVLGFAGDSRSYKDRLAQEVLAAILGEGMSSRLFIEVRERRGLAYSVKSTTDRSIDTGYLATYAGVDPDKAPEAVKVILDQTYGLTEKRYPIKDEELDKAKEYLKGHLALALEDTKDVDYFFAQQELFLKEVNTPEEVFKKIDKVTKEEVYREAKRLFSGKKPYLAVIGPFKDGSKFARLI